MYCALTHCFLNFAAAKVHIFFDIKKRAPTAMGQRPAGGL